jgi:DNA-binding MarR family transcriptional regulator
LRKNAAKVLLALHAGHDVPSSIAEKTGLKLPAVSAELSELEREGFVERLEPAAGEDQRTSPRTLTGRGAHVSEELMKTEVSPTAEAARELVPVFASFISRLTDEGCVTREHLDRLAAARLGPASGAFVCDEFLRQAQALHFVSHARSVFTLTTLLYAQQWADSLNTAIRSRDMPPVFQQLVKLAGNTTVWLRTTRLIRDRLSVALRRHDIRNVHPWSFDDARSEQLPVPTDDYLMIWENPEVMSHDLGVEHFRELVARATRRYCYVMDNTRLPPNIERLDFDADIIDR